MKHNYTGIILCFFPFILPAQGIVISSGATIECVGKSQIEINNGHFTNNGVFTPDSSLVILSGSSQDLINGTNNSSFYDLELNNSAGAVLSASSSISIIHQLDFASGILTTNNNEVVFNDNSSSNRAAAGRYIDGNCRKIGDDAFSFPMGQNSVYAPLTISAPINVTDEFLASYKKVNPDPLYSTSSLDAILKIVSITEYWTLNRQVGSSSVSVTLQWGSHSGVSTPADMRVSRWDGSQWVNEGGNSIVGNSSAGSVTSNSLSSFGPFTLGSNTLSNPLPVELIAFDADLKDNFVSLNWTSASETNTKSYIVERSINNIEWNFVGETTATGNSTLLNSYELIDYKPISGLCYYRLSNLDFDGKSEVLSNDVVEMKYLYSLSAFPNPASENVQVSGLQTDVDYQFRLFNLEGQLMKEGFLSFENNSIDLSTINPGTYLLNVYGAESKQILISKE